MGAGDMRENTEMITTPAKLTDPNMHYIPDLGRTDYGDPAEILGQANIDTVLDELGRLGINAYQRPVDSWACRGVGVVVDVTHPLTGGYLAELETRLASGPALSDYALAEAEHAAGYCQECGECTLPPHYGEDDRCWSCDRWLGYDLEDLNCEFPRTGGISVRDPETGERNLWLFYDLDEIVEVMTIRRLEAYREDIAARYPAGAAAAAVAFIDSHLEDIAAGAYAETDPDLDREYNPLDCACSACIREA
jgi:hypothetical protein